MSPPPESDEHRRWVDKFRDAFRGVWLGVRGESSFYVHFVMAAAVIVVGWVVRVTLVEWCLLILCITSVFVAELFNSAAESLARAIDINHNPHLAKALDICSGAVLVASSGAAVIGGTVFLYRLGCWMQWW